MVVQLISKKLRLSDKKNKEEDQTLYKITDCAAAEI